MVLMNHFWCFRIKNQITTIYPADVVLFEGILVFYFPKIRDLFHMKLFVDTDSDTRLARRGNNTIYSMAFLTNFHTFHTELIFSMSHSTEGYKGKGKRFRLCPESVYELCEACLRGVLSSD